MDGSRGFDGKLSAWRGDDEKRWWMEDSFRRRRLAGVRIWRTCPKVGLRNHPRLTRTRIIAGVGGWSRGAGSGWTATDFLRTKRKG